jgi:hypothetical protein
MLQSQGIAEKAKSLGNAFFWLEVLGKKPVRMKKCERNSRKTRAGKRDFPTSVYEAVLVWAYCQVLQIQRRQQRLPEVNSYGNQAQVQN